MNRSKGTRVFMLLTNDAGDEKRRYGTLVADEGLWDYSDVIFDDFPLLVQPILCYFLWTDEDVKPADFSAGWEA